MKKKLFAGFVIGIFLIGINGIANATTITTYTDSTGWSSAVGNFNLEDFQDSTLLPSLSYTTTSGGNINASGYFYDRPTSSQLGTTWSFDSATFSIGGDWNLAVPGGAGMGLLLTMTDGNTTFFAPEISGSTNNFWGIVSDTAFTSAFFAAGSQGGRAETYHLDNLVYGTGAPVPEPTTMLLLGLGLLGLTGVSRRKQ